MLLEKSGDRLASTSIWLWVLCTAFAGTPSAPAELRWQLGELKQVKGRTKLINEILLKLLRYCSYWN